MPRLLKKNQRGFEAPALRWLLRSSFISRCGLCAAARALTAISLLWTCVSSVANYPHQLAYFNEIAGGRKSGSEHLLHSSFDWGQDVLLLRRWQSSVPDGHSLSVALYCDFDPRMFGVKCRPIAFPKRTGSSVVIAPGWYAVSASLLRGMSWYSIPRAKGGRTFYEPHLLSIFRQLAPEQVVGGSILLYYLRTTMTVSPAS